ncbi:MAG: hypothetical protein HRT83_07125 [Hyphomicrobiaceae bacterium]|nr:hypothetical protein [Hyphomicrobiaceae bacterium]
MSVVRVAHNSPSLVLDSIASVDEGAEVVVVDNVSFDGTLKKLRETRATYC